VFALMGLAMTGNHSLAVVARLIIPLLALSYFVLKKKLVDWNQLHLSVKLFLIFVLYIFLKSVVQGVFLSRDYWILVDETPYLGFLWLLEVNQLWGIAFLIVVLSLLQEYKSPMMQSVVFSVFVWILFAFLLAGFVPYGINGGNLTGEAFHVFSYPSTDTAKLINLCLFVILSRLTIDTVSTLRKIIYVILFYGGIVGVYLTQSRAGIGSLIFGLIIFLSFYLYRKFDKQTLLRAIFMFAGVIFLITLLPSGSHQAVGQEIEKTVERSVNISFYRMKYIWPTAIELIADRPWFGYPIGSYPIRSQEILGSGIEGPAYHHPHNLVLQCLYHGGVVGMILGLGAVFSLLYECVVRYRQSSSSRVVFYLAPLCALSAVVLSHGLVDSVLYGWMALLFVQFALAESIESNVGGIFR
jgi:O-antigen ligase